VIIDVPSGGVLDNIEGVARPVIGAGTAPGLNINSVGASSLQRADVVLDIRTIRYGSLNLLNVARRQTGCVRAANRRRRRHTASDQKCYQDEGGAHEI
jgi:hypothetical protein